MWYKIIVVVWIVCHCQCVHIHSSFWAPLLEPRLLGYRVDASFSPRGGRDARALYQERYGRRGERLVASLSRGSPPPPPHAHTPPHPVNGDVTFYYTYPGADNTFGQ